MFNPKTQAAFDYTINKDSWNPYPEGSSEFIEYQEEYERLCERNELEVLA